jgi:hypothetical protein
MTTADIDGGELDAAQSTQILEAIRRGAREIVLVADAGAVLTILVAGNRAFMTYLREPGDSGFSSRGPDERPGEVPFVLSNGQEDRFPYAWTVDLDASLRAIEFFLIDGRRPDDIAWHEE